jgi:DNA (cytosine-5)-methyltransferase 1
MLSPQYLLPVAHELVIDLFAGGGGASCGIEQAIGRHVDIAVNHDPEAVSLHEANHPQTRHFVSDVYEVDPRTVTDGQAVGLLWASPDCTYHSKARGGKPHRDRNKARRRRGLAWVVCRWAREVRPRVIALENVEEWREWGPLLPCGTPCPERRGTTFARWCAQLRNLGYAVEWRELRACDYGAPTTRKRLFVIARCDGQPIVWPEPTHAKAPPKGSRLKPWRTAAECIDWSIPCPSIFERERPLADATLRRIAAGIMRYVVNDPAPYIVRIGQTGHGDGGKVRGVREPLSTVTTKAEHLIVSPTLVQTGYGEREGQAPRVPGLDKPLGTVVGGQKHALVAAFLARHYPGVVGASLTQPVPTITTIDHHSVVTTTPEPRADHSEKVRALLVAYYGSEQDGQAVTEPLRTIPTRDRFGLVTVRGEQYAITDIGMRMLQPRELYTAQGFPASYVIDRGSDGRTLTKSAQVRMCGNSVCPPLARAIVAANYSEAQAHRRAA